MKERKSVYRKGLLHHHYRFFKYPNFWNVFLCRIFGHRVSNNPSNNCCGRCGLAYEEIYHNVGEGWFMESGIIDKKLFNKHGNYKYSINVKKDIKEWDFENIIEQPLNKKVFTYLKTVEDEDLQKRLIDKSHE